MLINHKPNNYGGSYRAQLLKKAIGAMVDVDMNLMALKIIRREACLWPRCLSKLSMDLGPRRCPNI
jgi:hypothetical protein